MRPVTGFCFLLLIMGILLLGAGCHDGDASKDKENDLDPEGGPSLMRLSVTATGSGSVSSDPGGIACGQQCEHEFTSGTQVTLTATPDAGYELESWGGACSGAETTCDLALTEERIVTASFTAESAGDACEGVNCSNHGSCAAGGCVCDSGYTGADCSQCEDGYLPSGDDCILETSSVPLEGYGTDSSFGEAAGYEICTVTNLNDSGAGSLRQCISNRNGSAAAPTPRKVVFLVGGTITLTSDISLRQPHITIDGLSAPSPGITIAKSGDGTDGEFRVNTWPAQQTCAHDVLIQGLRFVGVWDTTSETHNQNAATIGIDGEDYPNCIENVVFNRLTITNAQDAAGDIWGSAKRITYQYCAFINSLHPQSHSHYPGGEADQERRYISIHHNLYAYNHERQTNIRGNTWDYNFEQNIVHAWDPYGFGGGYGTQLRCRNSACPERINLIDNYYTSSPATPTDSLSEAIVFNDGASSDQVYMQGNRLPSQESDRGTAASQFDRTTEAVVTHYDHSELTVEMLPKIGAPYRSSEEERLFDEVAGDISDGNPPAAGLSVSVTGSGSISSSPGGIACGQECQQEFTSGTQVTLTATPEAGYALESWGGACSGAAATCELALTEDRVVTATFVQDAGPPPVSGDFLGVPDPHGTVPAAIMPALPTAKDQIAAFPYDPIEMPTPQWNDDANQYWVDANGACDDGNNDGRGAPLAPRCSLPGIGGATWSLAADSQVFVVGNGASYGSGANINQMNFPGTEDEMIWIIGVCDSGSPRWANQPKLTFGRFFTGGGQFTHVAMENIHFYSPSDDFRGRYTAEAGGNPLQYLTFRHLTCSGSGTDLGGGTASSASRRCFNFIGAPTNPLRFVVIYDTDMFGLGRWVDDFDTDVDLIGMQVQGATYYVWFLNNRAFHFQGDSIHCSNSNQWNEDMDRRPHYIYVSSSEFYENYENSWDSKGCYHTVFSENYVHDYTNSVKGANNAALIAANDAESYVGGRYEWYLNNRFQDVGNAFAYKGTQQDAYAYFLGNLVSNTLTGSAISMEGRCKTHEGLTTCGDGMYLAQNTVDCNRQGPAVTATRNGTTADPDVPASEQNQEMTFIGNLFFDCLDAANADRVASPHGWETINANFQMVYNYNVDFRDPSLGPIALSAFNDEEIGNLTNVDPLLVDPTATVDGDYTLDEGSRAEEMVLDEPAAYTLFETMYGLSIRRDLRGNIWQAGGRLNAGAYQ